LCPVSFPLTLFGFPPMPVQKHTFGRTLQREQYALKRTRCSFILISPPFYPYNLMRETGDWFCFCSGIGAPYPHCSAQCFLTVTDFKSERIAKGLRLFLASAPRSFPHKVNFNDLTPLSRSSQAATLSRPRVRFSPTGRRPVRA